MTKKKRKEKEICEVSPTTYFHFEFPPKKKGNTSFLYNTQIQKKNVRCTL